MKKDFLEEMEKIKIEKRLLRVFSLADFIRKIEGMNAVHKGG